MDSLELHTGALEQVDIFERVCAHLAPREAAALAATSCSLAKLVRGHARYWRSESLALFPVLPTLTGLPAPKEQHFWHAYYAKAQTELVQPSEQVLEAASAARPSTSSDCTACNVGCSCDSKPSPSERRHHSGIASSPMLAWNENLAIENGLTLVHTPRAGAAPRPDSCGLAFVRSAFPFNKRGTALPGAPGVRYMEMEVLEAAEGAELQVGVVESSSAARTLNYGLGLGYYAGAWDGAFRALGVHSNGALFPGPNDNRWSWSGAPFLGAGFGKGDTVGVGVHAATGKVFFTRNGELAGVATAAASQGPSSDGQGASAAAASPEQGAFPRTQSAAELADRLSAIDVQSTADGAYACAQAAALRAAEQRAGGSVVARDAELASGDHDLDLEHCTLAVGLQGAAARTRINLGDRPFVYNLRAHVHAGVLSN